MWTWDGFCESQSFHSPLYMANFNWNTPIVEISKYFDNSGWALLSVPFAFPHTHLPMIQHRKVVTPGAVPCKGRFLSCSITQASTSSDWLYPIAVTDVKIVYISQPAFVYSALSASCSGGFFPKIFILFLVILQLMFSCCFQPHLLPFLYTDPVLQSCETSHISRI